MKPYSSRSPVDIREFFVGRMHVLNEIASFLRGSQSVSIVGPRQIGKTSLLFQLMHPTTWPKVGLGSDNLFVYLDCGTLSSGEYSDIFGQFAAEMAMALDKRGLPPEPALETAAARSARLSFEVAARKLNQRGLRVVLILDDFERLSNNEQLDVNFFNALRSAAGRYQLVFLTASVRPLIEVTYSGRSQELLSSPFFNIFASSFLGLLPEGEARQLIRELAHRAGTTFSPTTEDFIYALVGRHPLALQVACFHAFHVGDDHAEIERRTMQELETHFKDTWHSLTPAEQDILRRVAQISRGISGDTSLRGTVRNLMQKCLLVAEGETYRHPSQAWANFVAAQPRVLSP